jgi:hypothetical protein
LFTAVISSGDPLDVASNVIRAVRVMYFCANSAVDPAASIAAVSMNFFIVVLFVVSNIG